MASRLGSFSVVSYKYLGVFFQEGILSVFQLMMSVKFISVLLSYTPYMLLP